MRAPDCALLNAFFGDEISLPLGKIAISIMLAASRRRFWATP
jgi:hypothetical protein